MKITTDALVCSSCATVIPQCGADGRCPHCGSGRQPFVMNESVLNRLVADGLVAR